MVHLLPKLPEVTTIVALQHQLLIPSIAWAMPILQTLNSGVLPDCSIAEEVCFYHCITSDSLVFQLPRFVPFGKMHVFVASSL